MLMLLLSDISVILLEKTSLEKTLKAEKVIDRNPFFVLFDAVLDAIILCCIFGACFPTSTK